MDYDYLPVSNGSGDSALMHIMADRSVGATSFTVDGTVNVATKFIGTTGTLLSTGYIDPTTKKDIKMHKVDSTHVAIDAFEPGFTDTGNTTGQVIVVKPNTGWANRVASHIKNMTGFGTPESVTVAGLTASSNVSVGGNLTVTGSLTVSGGQRPNPRSSSTTSVTTLTPNIDTYNFYDLTAQAAGLTVANPTGTPRDGDVILIRIKDNGTSQTITYGTAYTNISGLDSLVATTISKWHTIGAVYEATTSKWQIVSITTEA
jgi:hypothetical protein